MIDNMTMFIGFRIEFARYHKGELGKLKTWHIKICFPVTKCKLDALTLEYGRPLVVLNAGSNL